MDQVSRLKFSVAEHDQIVHAIKESLPEEADRLLQLHILNLGSELRRMFSVLSTEEWPAPPQPRAAPVADVAAMESVSVK